MISDLLSSISQFLSLTHNTKAMLGMFGLIMTNSLQHVCPWTWQLNVQRPPYASLHKTWCLSSISHDALLFQLLSIGAVCSCSLHFHCCLPSLFPAHLHLRSALCGTLSLQSRAQHYIFLLLVTVPHSLSLLSFISIPLCPCLMLMIHNAGVISLKGSFFALDLLVKRWMSMFLITLEKCLRLWSITDAGYTLWNSDKTASGDKWKKAACMSGCALCRE